MHLGIQIEPQFGYSYQEIRDIAREAERAGFRNIWVSDHLFFKADSIDTNCLEAWTLLAALAVETTTVRIGTMVSCQSYRNPALLAKIAADVDQLSGGRLDFGIGAGWKEMEYRAYGYPFPSAGQRIDEMLDAVAICRAMWTNERASYTGRYHRVEDAVCAPKPVQTPLPMWIGGKGQRLFRAAARHAEWFNLSGGPLPEYCREVFATIDEMCRTAGRDPRSLHRSAYLQAIVADSPEGLREGIEAHPFVSDAHSAEDVYAQRPGFLLGAPEEIAARLATYADVGVGHANILFPYKHEIASLRRLAGVASNLS